MPLRRSVSETSETSGIVIDLYHDTVAAEEYRRLSFAEFDKEYTAEELCLHAARKLGITPTSFHLFSLTKPDLSNWLPPNATIKCKRDVLTRYVFRLRFYPQIGPGLMSKRIDRAAFNYFYLQCRDDFVNERITYPVRKEDKILGLGVVDMVRQAKERNMTLSELKKLDPSPFIPAHISKRSFKLGELFTKKKLQYNIEPHLEIEWRDYKEAQGVPVLKLRYLIEIKTLAQDFGVEVFQTASGDKVFIDPCHERFPGICINRGTSAEKYFAEIEDLSDASINNANVQINRNRGTPEFIQLKTPEDALSMVSLLDGYYRMMVDYHYHLCRDVQSPMIELLKQSRSHGPVRKPWAVKRLEQKHSENPQVNYLLKQKRDDFDTYRLYVWKDSPSWKEPLNIHRLHDGKFQLEKKDEPLFPSLPKLLAHYKSGKHPTIKLNEVVRPQLVDSWLYLCRAKFEDESDGPDSQHQQQRSKVTLVSDVTIIAEIGHGHFTEVQKGMLEKENGVQAVAVKQLIREYRVSLLEPFTHGVNRALFWSNNATIATIHALCLSPPFSILMEYAECGSLDSFLQRPNPNLKVFHLLTAAEQLAQALLYLEEETGMSTEGEVHGNLRCRNVLVFSQEKEAMRVKLGDPGLVHLYNRQHLDEWVNLERLAWIAPELYKDLSKMTRFSDRYAFGVLLWEMFSAGDHPFATFGPQKFEEQIQAVRKGHEGFQLQCPPQAPTEIFQMMQECWDHNAENRKSPRDMVRDIRNMVHSAPSSNEYHYPISLAVSDRAFDSHLAAVSKEQKDLFDLLKQSVEPPAVPGRIPQIPPSRRPSLDQSTDSRAPLLPRSNSGSAASAVINHVGSASGSAVTQSTLISEGSAMGAAAAAQSTETVVPPISTLQKRPLPAPPQEDINIPGHVNRDCLEISSSNGALLGKGYYGLVHKAILTDPHTGEKITVAVKSLRKHSDTDNTSGISEFEKEFNTMTKLEHENIVKLIGQCLPRPSSPLLLVMEFVAKGSLKDHLMHYKAELPKTPQTLLQFIAEIAQGMKYLSSQKVVHRDLAARNVLVTRDEHMKISDFGLSRILDPNRDYYRANPARNIPARWCAPECLLESKFSIQSDVWSYGVTVWEVYSLGEQPVLCESFDQIVVTLHQGKRLAKPEICTPFVYTLMKHCWEFEAKARMDFAQICDAIKKIKEKLGFNSHVTP